MRVSVDVDLCQGHAVCCGEAPEVFELDPETGKVRLLVPEPREALREPVARAVQYCPTFALSIVDTENEA
jgi:ferredoxin